jgi:hypothetical protein
MTPQLDDLLDALRSALLSAQRSLRQRQRDILQQYCEQDEQGALHSKMLRFSLPSGKDEDDYQTLTLPLLSLRNPQPPQLAGLTLSFDCEFILCVRDHTPAPQYRMRLVGKRRWWRRPAVHRVEIRFHGGEAPVGKVMVDGMLLKEIPPPEPGSGA